MVHSQVNILVTTQGRANHHIDIIINAQRAFDEIQSLHDEKPTN